MNLDDSRLCQNVALPNYKPDFVKVSFHIGSLIHKGSFVSPDQFCVDPNRTAIKNPMDLGRDDVFQHEKP